jgi:type IV pilus assembly protein PilB
MPQRKPSIAQLTLEGTELNPVLIDVLLDAKILTLDQLSSLRVRSTGVPAVFEKMLLQEGYLIDEQLAQLKAQVFGMSYVDLNKEPIDPDDLLLLPPKIARERKVVPLKKGGSDQYSLAMVDPSDTVFVRLLKKKFPGSKIYLTTELALNSALARTDTTFEDRFGKILETHDAAVEAKDVDDQSVIQLVDSLLLHGVRHRASDIHIEPREHETVVRERVDGILRKEAVFSKDVHQLVVLRIKVMANLATDEHLAPQDGKLRFDAEGRRVDVRVSILPTSKGEKIVMRLLVAESQAISLESIGLLGNDLNMLDEESRRSWGMILVTGPTGSGKTTSLYAVMRRLNNEKVNISTIEDPVEYDLPGANQIQVNPKVELTFATGLRSIVRQDPNIILVGEIRDEETAGIAVNAAMTGHLVLSTLHTNDAPTAIPRLVDMNIEPFLIASTVNMVIAQRLVRQICPKCRESTEITRDALNDSFSATVLDTLFADKTTLRVYTGKGCKVCNKGGFMGRTGIFELLRVTPEVQELIMKNADSDTIKKKAIEQGMRTMLDDGLEKVVQGMTTVEEVLRVIRS